MSAPTTQSSGTVVDAFLAAVENGAFVAADVFSEDVTIDATVPHWRFEVNGAEAANVEYSSWYAHPGRFEEVTRTPLPEGELVTFTLAWEEQGVPHTCHQSHQLMVRSGKIVADRVWCGGRWPASLLAEMEAAREARA
jgi:hypothetical protein